MKYSLGLDIGTTSVGWAVLNEDIKRIEDCGVRIFEAPENPKNGESLALPRRTARSARRRLKRRRQRLDYLKNFFINDQILSDTQIKQLLDPATNNRINPYEARTKAANGPVSAEELFVALYHIAKRRGYKSNRKKVEENSKDSGRVLKAIKENEQLLATNRTVGITLQTNEKFASHKRNKLDSYDNSFIREDFENETRTILTAQNWPKEKIEALLHDPAKQWGGIFDQRPFMTSELIKKMQGNCPFEKGEKRAAKASYSFELFRLAQDLSHLTYNEGNRLTIDEIAACVEKVKSKKTATTYKNIREILGYKNDENFMFDYIRGKDGKEENKFAEMRFYQDVKSAATPEDWRKIENNIDLFDEIGEILTVNKDDVSVEKALKKEPLSDQTINSLMSLSYSGFAHLSLKALRKLTPSLLNGATYDKAVEEAYPGEFAQKLSGNQLTLPPLNDEERDEITNPVVKRAIGQTRKVINAIIGKYGSPFQIKIECTNELAKDFKKRKAIKDWQDANAAENEKRVQVLKETFHIVNPTGLQITAYKLYEQQVGQCIYCGKKLDPEVVFTEQKGAEIDHIIPFSRCGNDSLNNKVLCCDKCNQEKTNHTPYEAWNGDSERWTGILARAKAMSASNEHLKSKTERIISEKPPKEDWNSHALNDTRYIMKFMAKYIRKNLKFSDDGKGKQKVVLPTGNITNYLRKMYHLGKKDRELNNCHHAVDACVIASVSQGQIKKFANYNKYKELGAKYTAVVDFDENGEPHTVTSKEYEEMKTELLPWEDFDKEVEIRTGMNFESGKVEPLKDFRDKFRNFKTYDEAFLQKIHPLFVSRMPKRSAQGQAHKETIRSPKMIDDGRRLTRKRLSECTKKDIEASAARTSDSLLYNQLMALINERGEKEAFKEPVYKNNKRIDKNGKPLSPIASIKIYSTEPSGILINHGTQFVNNGSTICLSIYKLKMPTGEYKYFAAPRYMHLVKSEHLEILPTPNGRSAEEKAFFDTLKDKDGRIYSKPSKRFKKVFDIFPNDYIRLTYPDHVTEGYYVKYGITGGMISLINHNDTSKADLDMVHCSFGAANSVEKLDISILGDNYQEPQK